ncbi:MAG TPA: 3-deoxy-8-phosphooctulonate synthase [Candidatus Kapabacteria bacterium]|nr:3-deoxy-8-phosphooctulonate synthase [Candidatus Kapabacteria bacterium]
MSGVPFPFSPQRERFAVLAGPCVVESRDVLARVAETLVELQSKLPVAFVFKSSYRKANRTSASSFTGIGDEAALKLLAQIKKEFSLPIVTDIHLPEEAAFAAEVADILQIPAFLARQSDLLEAAAATGKFVNIKKGQFMSPDDMKFAREKVVSSGNKNVLLTERGTTFGYGDLIVDFRSLVIMRSFGSPVIFDATHSVQRPSQNGISGGAREFIAPLARAAVAVGIDGLFIETHPDPANAKSDAASQLPLDQLEGLLTSLLAIRNAI